MVKRKQRSNGFAICRDHQGRTCLKVDGDQGIIKFVPLDIDEGLQVHQTSVDSFDQRFKEMPDYPIERGCQLYLNYSMNIGASDEVLDYVGQIINVTKEDREMATTKRTTKQAAATAKKKTSVKKKVTAKKKAPVKKAPAKKKVVAKKKAPVKAGAYASAAQMFQGLIMEGKLTDDKIFAEVQEKFGLDDKKRSYVRWYRNNLKKKGENPPESK